MIWLTLGYFVSYIPYAMLVKALTSGALPGVPESVNGGVLLPAAALGQLAVMPVFLGLSGRWREMRARGVLGRHVLPVGGRETWAAGFFTALIIGTTTLNFTFTGASILLMLILMRGGVLVLSPVIDTIRRRRIAPSSWVALGFSLLAIGVSLADVNDYRLTIAAGLSVAVYLAGYTGRFEIMSRVAKKGKAEVDRRYFAEEHATSAVVQVLLLAVAALLGQPELRQGFTVFLGSTEAAYAFAIGVAYEVLFVFGTLIYLDRREYTWCVPANRAASLMSGVVASYGLVWLVALPAPGSGQLIALVFIVCAVAALSQPTVAVWWRTRRPKAEAGLLLFVCGGNTCRSPMAAALARARLASAGAASALRVSSAGLTVARRGAPMTNAARSALVELGVRRRDVRAHRSRPVTAQLCHASDAIYCMTSAQRDAVLSMAPGTADRTFCLDAAGDIPDPIGQPADAYRRCARRIQSAVTVRLGERLGAGFLAAGGGVPDAAS
ncbi:hypothetical protein [Streptomyces gilvosporeus]|uniref:arsenate reductase/protein-tyrosine-phosphatase family protein n=1 Tax=Streptomyces gilvosporeus TaxID=553510 RepID=UPI00131B1C8A|nr:hypothetical protein [Streptomyces gilvosporeus]